MARKLKVVESTQVMVDGVMVDAVEYEAGLAQGLDAHATENALHAMGKDVPPPSMADAIKAAAEGAKKTRKRGEWTKDRTLFGTWARHEGFWLVPVEDKHRKGEPGTDGLEWLHEMGVVAFEDFEASEFTINHLNWDLKRGWVKCLTTEEAADAGHFDEWVPNDWVAETEEPVEPNSEEEAERDNAQE